MGGAAVTDATQIAQVARVRKQVTQDFMGRRNVVACGVGYKIKGEQQTDIPSVVVSVIRKEPPEDLSPEDLIPKTVNEVPTDVIETGAIVAYGLDRRIAMRPVRPGVSIGHQNGSGGTLSCIVRRGAEYFMLSNNHVLALINEAKPGDPILQPAPADGGTALDIVGQLAEFIPIRFLGEDSVADLLPETQQDARGCLASISSILAQLLRDLKGLQRPTTAGPAPIKPLEVFNYVDAALASPIDFALLDPDIVDLGGPPTGIALPRLGMPVIKSGRTSALTQGIITQLDVTVDVQYNSRIARFVDQIMVTPLSQPGDSGSLVLDYERRAVGLLFSGSAHVSVVNPIEAVLAALHVELVTES
jgi:hypothetical protein